MSYTTLSNFGSKKSKKIDVTDPANPLTYCLTDSLSTQFIHGPTSSKYHSRCKECQNYLKLRCAGKYNKNETWDKYCQFYFESNKNKYNSARGGQANLASVSRSFPEPLSFGEQLLHNAAEEKFIRYPYKNVNFEQFDPTVGNSPYIELSCNDSDFVAFSGHEVIIDKNGLDDDRLMNQMLKHPKAAANVLTRIYEAYNNNSIDISGTKLETHLNNNKNVYEQLLQRLINSDPNSQYGATNALQINKKYTKTGCACTGCDIPTDFEFTNKQQCNIINKTGLMAPCSDYQ